MGFTPDFVHTIPPSLQNLAVYPGTVCVPMIGVVQRPALSSLFSRLRQARQDAQAGAQHCRHRPCVQPVWLLWLSAIGAPPSVVITRLRRSTFNSPTLGCQARRSFSHNMRGQRYRAPRPRMKFALAKSRGARINGPRRLEAPEHPAPEGEFDLDHPSALAGVRYLLRSKPGGFGCLLVLLAVCFLFAGGG